MIKKLLTVIAVLAAAVLLSGCGLLSSSKDNLPDKPPQSRIVDTTDTLTTEEQKEIADKLQNVHDKYGAEMVVVMINDLGSESIENYSMNIAEKWKPGKKDVDNGLILLIAKNDHKMRLEVGTGLEGTITDHKAKAVIDSMRNDFKHGHYAAGIQKGIDTTIGAFDPEVASQQEKQQRNETIIWLIIVIVIIILAVPIVLSDSHGHWSGSSGSSGGGWSGGGFSGGGSSGGW